MKGRSKLFLPLGTANASTHLAEAWEASGQYVHVLLLAGLTAIH